jgi:hypothetical protein
LENGERVPLEVKEGDTVLFAKYAGTEVKLDGEEYMVIKESDVLAIVKQEGIENKRKVRRDGKTITLCGRGPSRPGTGC